MSILLQNARVFGCEDCTYIYIEHGIIEKIGSRAMPSATFNLDMNNALIAPGFCDTHTHLENIALMHDTMDLTGMTRDEVLQKVSENCNKRRLIVGRGWDESLWKLPTYITTSELDDACPNSEVILIREDGHIAVANSKLMKKYGMKGEVIRENDLNHLISELGLFNNIDLDFAQSYAISKGITCVHDFATHNTFLKYFNMQRNGKLKIRIFANFYSESYERIKSVGLYTGFGDEFLRIGALKIFADGSIGAKTAATEYKDGTVVKPFLNRNNIKSIVSDANSSGIHVFTHAIGNYAIDEVVAGYGNSEGNRIEHFELADKKHMVEGLKVSVQPNFLKWAKKGGLYHRMLSHKWFMKNNQYRNMVESGLQILFGSDCMPLNPLFGINMVVNEDKERKLSFEEAIKAYTIGAKYMSPKLGEIKKGYKADLVAIKNNEILLTMIDGVIRYRYG